MELFKIYFKQVSSSTDSATSVVRGQLFNKRFALTDFFFATVTNPSESVGKKSPWRYRLKPKCWHSKSLPKSLTENRIRHFGK